jgi:hypothetical protein
VRQRQAQDIGQGRGGLAAGTHALGAGDALDDHGEAVVVQIQRNPGKQMGGADGGERHADGADGELVIGAAHDVHGDGVGVGGEGCRVLPFMRLAKRNSP